MDKTKVEIYINNEWVGVDYKDLKEGDRFRIFNSVNKRHIDGRGRKEWIASSDAYEKFGDWAINILI